MKELVYFLLLFVSSTIQQNDIKYGTCKYDKNNPNYVSCDAPTDGNVLPDDISPDITKLAMNSLTIRSGAKLWMLTELDSFTRFQDLEELFISGEFIFSPNLMNTTEDLKKELFNIPTLTRLIVLDSKNWTSVGGNDKWTPPPNLEHLESNDLNPGCFDWRNVTSLEYVEVRNVPSTEILDLFKPSARSLREINNPLYYFKIDDIASFCHLAHYSFNRNDLQKRENYCECQRYLNWQKFLATQENVSLAYNHKTSLSGLVCSQNTNNLNCSAYTLDTAKINRAKCLDRPKTTTVKPSIAGKSSFWGNIWSWIKNLPIYALIIIGVLFFVSVVTCTVFVGNMMRYPDDEYNYEPEIEMEMEMEY